MIRDQFILDLGHELAVDNFAGGGGASTGIEWAIRRHVDLCVNHNVEALGMHEMNHPQTVHLREDVFAVDPMKATQGRPVALAWFSPDCKHFSKAKGGKPVDQKIRGLALVILSWAASVRPRVIIKENVEEIQTWGPLLPCGRPDPAHKGRTFRAFVAGLGDGLSPDHPDLPEILEVVGKYVTKAQLVAGLGYKVEWRELRACDYGAPTIRKRFFMIARCDGVPIAWPTPTHAAPDQAKALKLKPWRTAAECIDWSLRCPSIFLSKASARRYGCKRPLVRATMARIAKGVDRYVLKSAKPFIVGVGSRAGQSPARAADSPLGTVTATKRGDRAVVSPYFVPRYGERPGQEPRSMPVTQPMPVVVPTSNGASLVAPLLARTAHGDVDKNGKKRGRGAHAVAEPLPTSLATRDLALIAPVLAHAQHGGAVRSVEMPHHTIAASTKDQNQVIAVHLTKFNTGSTGSAADAPVPTVVAASHPPETRGAAATPLGFVAATMVKMRGDPATHAPGHVPNEPLHTVSAGGQHHAVTVAYLAQHNGGANGNQTIGHAATEPVSTLSSKGSQQAVVAATCIKYYGNETEGHGIDGPAGTVTTRDRIGHVEAECVTPELTDEQRAGAKMVADFLRAFGVEFDGEFATVEVDGTAFVIVDIGMRMLAPRELFRAQGFPESYIIDRAIIVEADGTRREIVLTKEAQIRMCGNSVCPPIAEALVRANLPELALEKLAA